MTRDEISPKLAADASGPAPAIPEDDPRVIRALEEYMSVVELGLKPDRSAFLQRHADVAPVLSDCLGGLDLLRRSGPGDGGFLPGAGREAILPSGPPETVLDDYRLLREVGRGGMGVVYEAEHAATGRRVAVKVLPYAALLDRTRRQRFRTEILAGAQLRHPNIVPVLAAGSERGIPFYVMDLIDGQSLASRIRALRGRSEVDPPSGSGAEAFETTWTLSAIRSAGPGRCPREVARLGLQAARALEHAHDAGIIHRDIKPANLLIDGDGRLYVTDFGLARLSTDLGLTVTGDLIGTVRYMSPEQALGRGGAVDGRTDLYSLGATLYELLTLRPAVEGQNAAEVLRRIAEVDPVPPRRLVSGIPRGLETILLRAMARDPADRYAGAGALADDLERFLDDRPIRARRASTRRLALGRPRSWRRPLRSGAVGLAVLLLGFAAGAWTGQVPPRPSPAAVPGHAPADSRSRDNLELAMEAVDTLYTAVAEVSAGPCRPRAPEAEESLREAMSLYQRLAEANSADDSSAPLVAQAQVRAGDLGAELDRLDDALSAYEGAARAMEALVRREPGTLQHRKDLASVLDKLGNTLLSVGRFDDAEEPLRRSLAILQELVERSPEDVSLRQQIASRRTELGAVLAALGRVAEAEESFRAAVELHQRLSTAETSRREWASVPPSSSS